MASDQFRHSLKFGSITGLIIFLYLMLIYFFGLMNSQRKDDLVVLVFIGGAVVSVRKYRSLQQNGILSFGQAYLTSWMTFVFTGVVWAFFIFLLYRFFEPDGVEEFINELRSSPLAEGMSTNYGAADQAFYESITASTIAFMYLFGAAFYGGFLSVIIALLAKSRKNLNQ